MNTGSTITLTMKDEMNNDVSIHMTVYKDTVSSNKRYSTITQEVSDDISASVSLTPIVTYTAENAFAFDVSANEQISFSFTRKNPLNANDNVTPKDDRVWSNRKWMEELSEFINRWQAQSDGCVMTYEPLDTTLQYAVSLNVYLQSITFTQNISSNEIVSGRIVMQVGSMTANAARAIDSNIYIGGYNDERDMNTMVVSMTSSDGLASYILYCKNKIINDVSYSLNCISEYTLKGGPEQPFEYLTMTISKKRLSVVAPNLIDDIVAGRNRIFIDAMGKGQFIVTKCSTQSSSYKIIAYSIYEIYRSITVGTPIPFGKDSEMPPYNIIYTILSSRNRIGMGLDISPIYFTNATVRYAYFDKNNVWSNDFACTFNNNASEWYVMSVCALKLNCKIWFSDNYVYIVDTSITEDMLASPSAYGISTNMTNYKSHITDIYLNTSDPYPLFVSDAESNFIKSVCDTPQLGDEGAETICNSVRIQFSSSKDSRFDQDGAQSHYTELAKGGYSAGMTTTGTIRMLDEDGTYLYSADVTPYPLIAKSQAKYGIRETVYKIPEIGDADANTIAINVAESYCDGEQSIGFTLKEVHYEDRVINGETVHVKYWQKYFPSFTQIDEIHDYSNDLKLSNMSNFSCAETTTFVVSPSNYNVLQEFQVPMGTPFRILYSEGSNNTAAGVGAIPSAFNIYDMNDNPITTTTQYTIIDIHTINDLSFYIVDIKIERPCYVQMYLTTGVGTYTAGEKIKFTIGDRRQKLPNKLCLSTFEHHFPEGTTEYWFGIMKPTDITQNTSEIHNAMFNQ